MLILSTASLSGNIRLGEKQFIYLLKFQKNIAAAYISSQILYLSKSLLQFVLVKLNIFAIGLNNGIDPFCFP